MEIIENEKKFNTNYKKIIWILIVFNIIFLLGIFALNCACYSALESKCEDNIQLSANTSKQDKKNAFDGVSFGNFRNGLDYLNYSYFFYQSMNNDEIEDFIFNDYYLFGEDDSIVSLNGVYNFFVELYCEFEYINYISSNNEPYFELYFDYDYYDNNGANNYFSLNLRPYLNNVGEFWNSEGSYKFSLSSSFSSLSNYRTRSLTYDSSYGESYSYFNLVFNFDNFDLTEYTKFEFLIYFVPVGDSSELGNYQAGYDKGYQDGLNNADVYEYAEQYYNNGFNAGYQEGIQKGIEESGNNVLGNMLLSIFDVPLTYLSSLLNFNLLGINLLGLLGAILCIGLIAFLIKKLL